MIEVKDLTIKLANKTVLENINLSIPRNVDTIIVGRSGCGKSVLVKTIEGLIKPLSGKVIIDGKEIFSLSRKELNKIRKKIAMLFQGSALLDSLNVFQNVALPLFEHRDLDESEIQREVIEKLNLVGLFNVETKMPSELSGGMKKRVALARAIILKPDYIIYDEPTTGLDPVIATEITSLILKLQSQYSLTSIVISHDFDFISKLDARIIMIEEKKIIFDGKWKEFKKATNQKIVSFISSI